MTARDDHWLMAAALGLAARGLGQVWPNPAVGCVIAQPGAGGERARIVGRGHTQAGGRPHAEAVALAMAGAAARGATAYVTLEPCAHHGHTPPCAEALAAAGIARLVCPMTDPDPRVSGRGFDILRAAGVQVDSGPMAPECAVLNEGFVRHRAQGRPMLTLKLAMSADGRIATAGGESRWISCPEARAQVHMMRARHDAVMVGGGTARVDDPMLDVRLAGLGARQPVRVVLSASLSPQPDSRLGRSAREVPLWLLHGPQADPAHKAAWEQTGALLVPLPADPGGTISLHAALQALAQRGLTRVFCEGGGTLAAGLLRAGLVDHLVQVGTGLVLGAEGLPAVGPLRLGTLADHPRLELLRSAPCGADVITYWRRPGNSP